MKLLKKLLQAAGIKSIRCQLLLLSNLLVASGLVAMGVVYFGIQADAATINTAGKQRMLSQRVAKEVFMVQKGFGESDVVRETIQEFDHAMQQLINGDSKNKISAPATPDIARQLQRVVQLWKPYQENIQLLLTESRANNVQNIEEQIYQSSPIILKEMNRAVKMMEAASNQNVKENMFISMALIFSLLLLSLGFYRYVSILLMQPLFPLREALKKLAAGTLNHRLPLNNDDDEIMALYRDYNQVLDGFSGILGNVIESSEQLSVSSLQLKKAATANAIGMEQQHLDIDRISTSMHEIRSTIEEVASSSANAAEYAGNAERQADHGRQTMQQATVAIDELNHHVASISTVVHTLNENSRHINRVLDVINEIAEQTNLLALNAAIEAARAGDAGRGFAVVADEVRGLAARTANSTSEIQQMVEQLQHQAQQSVQAIDIGQEKAISGVEFMRQADSALQQIADAVVAINEKNGQIAAATRAENEVANEMNQRIVQVAETASRTQKNAADNRDLATHLSEVGEKLRKDTLKFNL